MGNVCAVDDKKSLPKSPGLVCAADEELPGFGPMSLTVTSSSSTHYEVTVEVLASELVGPSLERELRPYWGSAKLKLLRVEGQEVKIGEGATWHDLLVEDGNALQVDMYEALTDDTIQEAVNTWCGGKGANPDVARIRWGSIQDWDVSQVTSMQELFKGQYSFNSDISQWDVSNVRNTSCMFFNAQTFNQPLESWDVSQVERADGMFYKATEFNQSLEKWNVRSMKQMDHIFKDSGMSSKPTWAS